MKKPAICMSAKAVTGRIRRVSQLRELCLALAASKAANLPRRKPQDYHNSAVAAGQEQATDSKESGR